MCVGISHIPGQLPIANNNNFFYLFLIFIFFFLHPNRKFIDFCASNIVIYLEKMIEYIGYKAPIGHIISVRRFGIGT